MTLLMSQGLRFIYVFFIARLLGAELYGLLAFGNAWYLMFSPLADLGLGIYLLQKVGKNPIKAAKRTVPLVASIRFIAVTLIASICLGLGLYQADSAMISQIVAVFSLALIGRAMVLWSTQMFQAYEKTIFVFKLERIFKPLEVTLGLLIAYLTGDVILVAAVHALSMFFQGLVGILWVNQRLVRVTLLWRPKIMLGLVVKLLPLGLAVALGQFLFQGPVVLLKQEGISLIQIGNFSLAIQLFIVSLSIFSSLKTAALPALSRHAIQSPNKLRDFSRYSIILAVVFGCLSSLVVSQYAEPVVVWLFTENFRLAGQTISLLIWALIPAIIHNMLNSTQAALEHNKSILMINAIGAILLVLGMYEFTEMNVLAGAAYAVIAGFTGAALTSIIYLVYKGIMDIYRGLLLPSIVIVSTIGVVLLFKPYIQAHFAMLISAIWLVIITWTLLLKFYERKAILAKVMKR
jgi:O-antigen/teichoic acid export membrane protein